MKKNVAAIVLLLIVLFCLFFLYKVYIGDKVELKKISAFLATPLDDSLRKEHKINQFRVNQAHYFEYSAITRKGNLMALDGNIKKMSYRPNLRGDFVLHVELIAKPKAKTTIKLYHNSFLLAEKKILSERSITFQKKVKLAKKDKVTLVAKGIGVLIIENPILFKAKPPEKRGYVFLICADTLRADHLPIYGYGRRTAPNIKSFAEDSVVFKHAYAQAPWTLPSHMSLFTSLYEFNHGVKRGTVISENIDYLIEELSQDFSTRSFNGGIYVSSRFGFFRGFDHYKSIPMDQFTQEASENLFTQTIRDLEIRPFPKSFYFLHTYQTHSPYNPPLDYLKIFNESPKHKYLSPPTVGSRHKDQYKKMPKEMLAAYIDLYDAEIYTFDVWFGKFVDYLKKNKLYDASMIIFLSDHGEEFFDHSGWGHVHSLYNELIKVPLIIKFPRGEFKGIHVETEVGLIDVMPTILNYYHIPFNKKSIDGKDLVSIIKGKNLKRALISSLTSGFYIPELPFKISKIQNNKKIIFNMPYTKKTLSFFNFPPPPYSRYEFYDLIEDPEETNNNYMKKMKEIRKYRNLFDQIIQKGKMNIRNKGMPVELDKKMIEALKSLGYL